MVADAPVQSECASTEAVTNRRVSDPVELDELFEDAVNGRSGQPGAARGFFETEVGCPTVEGVENEGHPLDHRRR